VSLTDLLKTSPTCWCQDGSDQTDWTHCTRIQATVRTPVGAAAHNIGDIAAFQDHMVITDNRTPCITTPPQSVNPELVDLDPEGPNPCSFHSISILLHANASLIALQSSPHLYAHSNSDPICMHSCALFTFPFLPTSCGQPP